MLLLAAIAWAEVVPLIIGIFGVAGLIFTALRYRRDDTTAVLNQQSLIVNEMKTLNDTIRIERDELKTKVEELTTQVAALREELQAALKGVGNG
jgi:hypothetical protein